MNRRAFVLVGLLCLVIWRPAGADVLDTRHYRVHTDLDPQLAQDLARRMDLMYDEYAQRLAVFNGGARLPRLQAYLFRRQRDYNRFTRSRLQNSGGVFLPGQNLLAAFLEGQGRDTLRRTLQHEAFHQFAYNAISPNLPIWLNEGLAQLFEEGLWNGGEFLVGEIPPRRVRELRSDFSSDRVIPFSTLLNLSTQQWADRLAASRADGATQYNQSWAIVHFLVMAHDDDGHFLYRARLLSMLQLLHDGRSPQEAFRASFGTNVEGFQDRFVDYARSLRPTAEATMIENQGVLADLLIEFDHQGTHFSDVESFRRFVTRGHYRVHYSRGEVEWNTDRDMNKYFSDLSGKPFPPEQLYFSTRGGAALPDLVCQCGQQLALRTRFCDADDGSIEHELLIEPVRTVVSISDVP